MGEYSVFKNNEFGSVACYAEKGKQNNEIGFMNMVYCISGK